MSYNNFNDDKLNNQHPSNEEKRGLPEVPVYSNLLSKNRKNFTSNDFGFEFDVDTFENLIDSYSSKEEILGILSLQNKRKIKEAELDKACKYVYGYDFKETYRILLNISNIHMKKVFKNLSASGNATAMSITSRYLMKLEDNEQKDAINIRILNDLDNK